MKWRQSWTCKWVTKETWAIDSVIFLLNRQKHKWNQKENTQHHRCSYRSAMSCSCSGGTGTPFTDLSLWIWLKVCLCSSRFFKISCKTTAWAWWRIRQAKTHCAEPHEDPSVACYLVLLEFPVQHVGRLLVSVLKRNLLPEGQLCPVQPGSHHSQGTGKRFVQVDVPVQQLQLMSNFKKELKIENELGSWLRTVFSVRNVPTC